MSQGGLLRFLELLQRELGADDARAEVGGRDPEHPGLLWTNLDNGYRLVVSFAEPPANRAEQQAKLERLVEGFTQTLSWNELPDPPAPPVDSISRRIDAALEGLRARTGAVGALIVDVQSPVLWGSSEPRQDADSTDTLTNLGAAIEDAREAGLDLGELLMLPTHDLGVRLRELGGESAHTDILDRMASGDDRNALRRHLLNCVALARARKEAGSQPETRWMHHEPGLGYFVRSMANIYLLVLVFDGEFSELHVESAVVHALPSLEVLLLSLPPLDPPPERARVLRFPK